MKKEFVIFSVLIGLVFLVGCTDVPVDNPTDNPTNVIVDDSEATSEGVSAVVNGNNEFAFDVYSKFKDQGENLFFSPWSISSALAMTYEGARGTTADEMKKVLHFSDSSLMRPGFAKIQNQINAEEKSYLLSTANALWAQKNYSFLSEYFGLIDSYYGGKVTNLDFAGETEKSRVTINSWVEEKTNNKIKDLIPQGLITQDTALVLTNAIYFKGNWLTQFKKENTREQDFKISEGETISVEMMHAFGEDYEFKYAETEKLQILELPYVDEELSMLVLLPSEGEMDYLESNLTAQNFGDWKSNLRMQEVNVYLPKFKFETKYFMKDVLKELGMATAFSAGADFSGMTGQRDLFISEVIHQAFVEVNEEGTEAAAATAVIMPITAVEPYQIPEFKANHPFIFVIQENETGSILFIGRVDNPTA